MRTQSYKSFGCIGNRRTFAPDKREIYFGKIKLLWFKNSRKAEMFNLRKKGQRNEKDFIDNGSAAEHDYSSIRRGENNEAAEAAKYEINFNIGQLSKALDLSYDQTSAVTDITKMFASDMTNAAAASGNERAELRKKAINRDLAYMRTVLDKEQYHKYLLLLNTTMNNRGLNK